MPIKNLLPRYLLPIVNATNYEYDLYFQLHLPKYSVFLLAIGIVSFSKKLYMKFFFCPPRKKCVCIPIPLFVPFARKKEIMHLSASRGPACKKYISLLLILTGYLNVLYNKMHKGP